MTTARISVYLQALGGKFLGPNAYNTNDIKLTLTLGGETTSINYKYVDGMNDGEVDATFSYDNPPNNGLSSFLPVLTPITSVPITLAVNYLTPIQKTIFGYVEVNFSEAQQLGTLSASIPRPSGEDLILTESIALDQMQSDYRAIMIVPGLLLEKPPSSVAPPTANYLYLWVKMMCGCPITTGLGNSFWSSLDFDVSAEVFLKNGSSYKTSLSFTSNATPSLYQVPVAAIADVHMVNFTAKQKSTANIGYLSVIYSLC
ncbi:MAG TPA: hypothetical protein VI306_25410 [Pyrinomonadaceae bacterium]